MKLKYESMLGRKDIEVLHNGAEKTCYEISKQPPTLDSNSSFNLCFLGGLFSHLHGECIEDFFHVVSKIRAKIPKLEFHLFGQVLNS